MKKLLLLIPCLCIVGISLAQLSGSSYYQDFNNLNSGSLPYGWQTDTIATATNIGTSVIPYYHNNTWKQVAGGFKNVASAHGLLSVSDSTTQANSIDRALAVRQTSGTSSFHGNDPGAAFIFKIDNTNNLTGFNLEVELQSLDSTSPRQTTWAVDYGLGSNPASFVTVTTSGNTNTGFNTFSTNNITASFGSALDHQNQPVWIRIIALTPSVGSGTRATTAIDNFHLTWTGIATAVNNITPDKSIPLNVTRISGNTVLLSYSLGETADMKAMVYDMSGREVRNMKVKGLKGSNSEAIDLHLPFGMYIIKLTNGSLVGTAKFTL